MHQVVYNSSRFNLLEMTDPDSIYQMSRFAKHFDPLMIIFSPVYWLYPKTEVLLIGQTIFLASGAIPLYLLAQLILKKIDVPVKPISLFFVFFYLNYFPLQKVNIFDFHAVALTIPLLLWGFYFIEIKKYTWSFIFFLLSMLGKENVALTVGMIGLYIAFVKKQRSVGITLAIISFIVFLGVVAWVIPSQRSNLHFAASYFSTDIMTNVYRLFSKDSIVYLYRLFLPIGFLSLFAPLQLAITLPEFMINLLSKNINMRDLQYHYTAILIPFIFVSSLYGFNKIYLRVKKKFPQKNITHILYGLLACVSIMNMYSAWSMYPNHNSYVINEKKLAVVRYWEGQLQNDQITIAATGHLAPYFSGRKYFYNFLFDFSYETRNITDDDLKKQVTRYEQADYVLINQSEVHNPHKVVRYYYEHLKQNKKYRLIYNQEGIEVYKKNATD
jgi:uncharacterized membrane protein